MRILIDARSIVDPTRGGVSRGVGRVALAFTADYALQHPQDQIVCVTTGARTPTLPEKILTHHNVTHIHLKIPNKIWSVLCILRIASLVDAVERRVGKIDQTILPNVAFIGRMTMRYAGARKPRPYTILLHDLSFLIEPRWFSWRLRIWHRAVRAVHQIKNAAHLLAVSERTKQDAVHLLNIPAEKISVISMHASDVGAHGHAPYHGDPYVLILGANDPRKNSATAILAAERVGIRSVVLGKDLNPSDAELVELYANASAFLYPSWYEGYGLPLHEAARYGIPCIASTAGALPQTAPPETLFANPAKPHQWVEALNLALKQQKSPLNH